MNKVTDYSVCPTEQGDPHQGLHSLNRGKRLSPQRKGNALFEITKLKNRKKKKKFYAKLYHNDVKETECLKKIFSYHFMKVNLPSKYVL